MAKVRILSDRVANQIAAGEVIERPAAVVKELVENAIDAEASRIVVTTAGGGQSLIRIEDDGLGMDEADLVLSVERHATSKLNADDLDDIRTLGFRGEALASIGAVSDLSISSRRADAETGLVLDLRHGIKGHPMPRSMNRGTIVEVRNLFGNVPARRKFLKSERAEAAAVTDQMKRLAMSNPGIHFIVDGPDRTALNWPAQVGPGALRARLGDVLGADFGENSVTLGTTRHGLVVTGLAGLPTYSRANSLSQYFFVNGRSVRDKVLLGAVRAAYADFLFRDRFPVVALFVAIDPGDVDVNVHPTKAELRFRDAGAVRGAVIRAIGEALAAAGHKAASTVATDIVSAFQAPGPDTGYGGPTWPTQAPLSASAGFAGFAEPSARDLSLADLQTEAAPSVDYPLGSARTQVFDNFIIAQNETGLLLVDQHAAHERLVYERFKAALGAGPVARQLHLIPPIVALSDDDCARIEAASDLLTRLGLELDRFGPGALAVRGTPALLGDTDIEGLVRDVADVLAEWDTVAALEDRLDAVIGRMACHGSVRSGRRLRVEEMNALLRQMEQTPHSGQCIHGRPTYVELKKTDIERLFGRTR
jgi:DNA mismatch repair protein MutL